MFFVFFFFLCLFQSFHVTEGRDSMYKGVEPGRKLERSKSKNTFFFFFSLPNKDPVYLKVGILCSSHQVHQMDLFFLYYYLFLSVSEHINLEVRCSRMSR